MRRILKVNRLVPLGFSVVFLLMGATTLVSQGSLNQLVKATDWVTHTYKVKTELKEVEKLLLDAETGQRGFLLTGNPNYLVPYHSANQSLKDNFSELRNEVKDNPDQLNRLRKIETLEGQKFDELAATIKLKEARQEKELITLVLSNKGKQFMDQIRSEIADMSQEEDRLLAARQKVATQTQQIATILTWTGTLLAIAIGSVISFVVAELIMRPINQAAEAIASSASEIAASTEQQEQTVTWQSVAVNKTSSTIDELGTASRQSAAQAAAAAAGTQQVLTLIEGNQASDRSTPKGSLSLREKVGQITEQILRLSEQTHQIGTISTLVSDLANQINVLALNAAVEAVRAGDHGKGFGVVASEIRKLADESKQSAARINSLVVDIQKATHSTVTVTDEGRKTVEDIIGEINNISLNSQQISLTVKQQAIAIQQVVDAMTTLNQGAAQTASAIRQARVGTQQLNAAAQNLKSIV